MPETVEAIIARVQQMECCFDRLATAVRQDPDSVREDPALHVLLRQLLDYYDGGQWLADYAYDECGLLPRGLKRGVLSQDGVYDLLADIGPEVCEAAQQSCCEELHQ